MKINEVYFENCLQGMKRIKRGSVDLILSDLPYGTTQNSWDSVLPLDVLWDLYLKALKPDGVICLHAMEMFAALLMMSNPKMYRFKWYWQKDRGTGHLNSKKMPLKDIEEILVFSPVKSGKFTYNPQMTKGEECHSVGKSEGISQKIHSRNNNYGDFMKVQTKGDMKYPKTLLYFPRDKEKLCEAQKPLALEEYMVKTHSNTGDLVLDSCAGSGTIAKACINTGRNFICFEDDPKNWDIAIKRIRG